MVAPDLRSGRPLLTGRGNIRAVARATGKARQQVHRWIKHYFIDPNELRE